MFFQTVNIELKIRTGTNCYGFLIKEENPHPLKGGKKENP